MDSDIRWGMRRILLLFNLVGELHLIYGILKLVAFLWGHNVCFSKPLNYAIALNELGSSVVHKYVGQEPSGGKFNALELDYNSEKK